MSDFALRFVVLWFNRNTKTSAGFYGNGSDGHYVTLRNCIEDARFFRTEQAAAEAAGVMRNHKHLGRFPKTKAEWKENPPYKILPVKLHVTTITEEETDAGNEAA